MSAAAIIEELLEYFEDRADASMEQGEDRFHGNKEMSLLQEVQKLEKYISDVPRWIPVGEKLPDADTVVLGALSDSDEPVWLVYLDGDHWMDVDGFEHTVTHWMPLPEPPK